MIQSLKFLFTALLLFIFSISYAGEGMWLPHLLKLLNEKEMKSMGMKISAEDIYSVNKGSLKDAIVHFGGFCTSEIISPDGLLLTNHHCGYGAIQSHSSVEN
nr:S46 family peptidase [Saprospiraceae bacterium]